MKVFYLILLTLFILCMFKRKSENFTDKICGANKLNRINIWVETKKRYGEKIALTIFPKTYILPNELNKVLNDKNKHFILKKTMGYARNGLLLVNKKIDIIKNKDKYNLAQVFIKNPYLINGFKFDIRIFMVSICGKGTYLFTKGYNVYTKNKFNYHSMKNENKINQSFTDDKHYDINNLPRTTDELRNIIDINKVYLKLARKLKFVLTSVGPLCCDNDKDKIKTYGLDVELLDNLDPMIIEINNREPVLQFSDKWKQNIINEMKDNVKKLNFDNWIKLS